MHFYVKNIIYLNICPERLMSICTGYRILLPYFNTETLFQTGLKGVVLGKQKIFLWHFKKNYAMMHLKTS